MNLSEVGVKLRAENIQSFIDDFLNIQDVKISDIRLYDGMILINKIKYKSFGISLGLCIDRVEDGVVSISVKKLKAISIPINIFTVNIILKIILSKINIPGITFDENKIKLDLRSIFKEFKLDFVNLDIRDIKITEDSIDVIVGNINLDMNELIKNPPKKQPTTDVVSSDLIREYSQSDLDNQLNRTPEINQSDNLNDNEEINNSNEEKNESHETVRGFMHSDKGYFLEYSRVRDRIYYDKFYNLNKQILGKVVFILPDIGVLCYRLLRDKRVKRGIKGVLIFTIVYLMSPVDLISKKFTILDKIDDSILLVFTLNKIFTGVDKEILEYHFNGDEDTLNFLIDSFDILNSLVGGEKINKLYTVFEKFIR